MAASGRQERFKVLVTDYAWPSLEVEEGVLWPIADLVVPPDRKEETFVKLAPDVHAIMVNWAQVSERMVQAAERCVILCRYGVGIDNLPVDLATKLGILVSNIPDYCVDEVTDHAMGLLIALNRRIFQFDTLVRAGRAGEMELGLPVLRLRGRKLGIVGLGRIGRLMAQKAVAFDMEVAACDPYVSEESAREAGVQKVDLAQLLMESDFVSIHAPLTPETRGLIGEPELRRMKPSAFLINVARGPLVQTDALVRALRERWIAGAGLDVLETEPVPSGHPLLDLDNVTLTPHVAFFSQQSVEELTRRCAQQVRDVLEGRMPENLRNPEVLPKARARLQPT
ncbi:MAG: C-terminal binding protein [Dehalococcoidia bacterium]